MQRGGLRQFSTAAYPKDQYWELPRSPVDLLCGLFCASLLLHLFLRDSDFTLFEFPWFCRTDSRERCCLMGCSFLMILWYYVVALFAELYHVQTNKFFPRLFSRYSRFLLGPLNVLRGEIILVVGICEKISRNPLNRILHFKKPKSA